MTTEPAATGPRCRGCGAAGARLRGTKHSAFLGRDFEYWDCAACGMMFVEPFAGYQVYDDAYYQGRGADPYVDYETEYRDYRSTDRIEELRDLWRVASGFVGRSLEPGPVEWLDFGCGAGGLLQFLSAQREIRSGDRSWPLRLSGHDIGTYADRLRRDGFEILSLDALHSQPDGRYDVISLIEVIEHIEYPDEVFRLVARLLKPGGLLLLTTGNVASPAFRVQGLGYGYCMPEVHVSYFTPRALGVAYARHGLVPVCFRYDGTVRFKVIKTLRTPGRQRLARLALRFPPVVWMIDFLFGTSRMPCATKPRAARVART